MLAAAAVPQTDSAQEPPLNEDLKSAREQMSTNIQQIAKVKLPMATEPAFHFKA
jgi:hypothetical protein